MDTEQSQYLLSRVKADSLYFITKNQQKDQKFSIEKNDEEISDSEREIRWHGDINHLISYLMLENEALKARVSELEEVRREYVEEKNDLIVQKNIILDELEKISQTNDLLVSRISKIREEQDTMKDNVLDKLNEFTSFLENCRSIPNLNPLQTQAFPQVKINPPKFTGESDFDRPMQFLSSLQEYISAMHVPDICQYYINL